MELEIFHIKNLNLKWKTIYRNAVRGIIKKGDKFLLVLSKRKGDYKFPGGGIDKNESFTEALTREIKEECGAKVIEIFEKAFEITEYNKPDETDYELFSMTSEYYFCSIENILVEQNLDLYERELDFTPVWISVEDALFENMKLLNSEMGNSISWLKREIEALKILKED